MPFPAAIPLLLFAAVAVFNAEISRVAKTGGGKVTVPAGVWEMHGPLVLKGGVELHLERGAELFFPDDFNNPEDTIYLGAQNSGPLPHCWQKLSPYLNSGPYCTSDSCLTFYSTNNEYKVAILPRLSNDLLVSHLKMSFDCKKLQYYYPSSLIVGVIFSLCFLITKVKQNTEDTINPKIVVATAP